MKDILIVEDSKKHLEDAMNFLKEHELMDKVLFARTYEEASYLLFKPGYVRFRLLAESPPNPDTLELDVRLKGYETVASSPELLQTIRFKGVIFDIYLPLSDSPERYQQIQPIGVRAAVELSSIDLPFVLNTSSHHDDADCRWIYELQQEMGWPEIVGRGGVDLRRALVKYIERKHLDLGLGGWSERADGILERVNDFSGKGLAEGSKHWGDAYTLLNCIIEDKKLD